MLCIFFCIYQIGLFVFGVLLLGLILVGLVGVVLIGFWEYFIVVGEQQERVCWEVCQVEVDKQVCVIFNENFYFGNLVVVCQFMVVQDVCCYVECFVQERCYVIFIVFMFSSCVVMFDFMVVVDFDFVDCFWFSFDVVCLWNSVFVGYDVFVGVCGVDVGVGIVCVVDFGFMVEDVWDN